MKNRKHTTSLKDIEHLITRLLEVSEPKGMQLQALTDMASLLQDGELDAEQIFLVVTMEWDL